MNSGWNKLWRMKRNSISWKFLTVSVYWTVLIVWKLLRLFTKWLLTSHSKVTFKVKLWNDFLSHFCKGSSRISKVLKSLQEINLTVKHWKSFQSRFFKKKKPEKSAKKVAKKTKNKNVKKVLKIEEFWKSSQYTWVI